jgi:hypothetical protein
MDTERALREAVHKVLGHDIDQDIYVTIMQIARYAAEQIVADRTKEAAQVYKDFYPILSPFLEVGLGPYDKITALAIEGPDGETRIVPL